MFNYFVTHLYSNISLHLIQLLILLLIILLSINYLLFIML